jgi:hypothetical protein
MSCIMNKAPQKIAKTKAEDVFDEVKPGHEFPYHVMWRFEVRDQNGREIKVSQFVYGSEEDAREAATEYMKDHDPRGGWSIGQSHQ